MYNFKFQWLKKYSKEILISSWAIMLLAYIWNGGGTTRRFLVISGINILTTSDFARFALIIFTASFIANNKKNINNIKKLFIDYIPYSIITLAIISNLFLLKSINLYFLFTAPPILLEVILP